MRNAELLQDDEIKESAKMAEYSCIPMRQDFRHFVVRRDFQIIAKSRINGALLCCAEIKTNEIIAFLRKRDGLPKGVLPPEEDRWFELPAYEAETISCGVFAKSTYASALRPEGHKGIPSLMQLGFLRRRFIARKIDQNVVQSQQYILVNSEGYYEALDGTMHSAVDEGYSGASRQFLLLIDQVNDALAKLSKTYWQ